MSDDNTQRAGEVTGIAPQPVDAGLVFIGHAETPWQRRADCPRQGDAEAGPLCTLVVAQPWRDALAGLAPGGFLDVLTWLDGARRDLLVQVPRGAAPRGTFALRSPNRPNPIGLSRVRLEAVEEGRLLVRGLDCVSGTPLLDIKPARCPAAASRPGHG